MAASHLHQAQKNQINKEVRLILPVLPISPIWVAFVTHFHWYFANQPWLFLRHLGNTCLLVSSGRPITNWNFMQCSEYIYSTLDHSSITLIFGLWHNSYFFSSSSLILVKHLTLQDFSLVGQSLVLKMPRLCHSLVSLRAGLGVPFNPEYCDYSYNTELFTHLVYRAWKKFFCAPYLFFRKVCGTKCGSQEDADRAVSIVCSSVADPESGHCSCEEFLISKGVSVLRMPAHT